MKNPFVYGKEVSGNSFCNRNEERHELYRDIVNSQNVIIFSQRRLGKTSLIRKVFEKCKTEEIITIYVDLYPMMTEKDFINLYAKAIAQEISGDINSKIKKISKFFKKIQPSFSVNGEGQVSYNFNFNDSNSLEVSLEDVIESVNRIAESKKKKIAVCFDEFQQIGLLKDNKIEKILRSYIQRHKSVAYILMGSKKHLIYDMFNNTNRPFYRSAKPFPLEKIGADHFLSFIKNKFESNKKNISDKVIKEIINLAERHSYYVQYLCYILWEQTLNKKNIDHYDIEKSFDLLIERESSTFEALWNLLTMKQKQVLKAVANILSEEKIFSSEFILKHKLGAVSTFQRTLQNLIEKDLIDRKDNVYTIIDIFFKEWIKRLDKDLV